MRQGAIIVLVVLVALALIGFFWIKPVHVSDYTSTPVQPEGETATPQENSQQTSTQAADIPDPNDPRLTRLSDGRVFYNPSVEASRMIAAPMPPEESLGVISQILDHYRYAYQENPVGENSEITAQLLGNNPKKIIFIAPDCKALLGDELADSWGTPLFFHALSEKHMELVSAGPDREFWTDDDLSNGEGQPIGH
ncbi:hypothetical protein [Haloferula sp.]|uniref:hypothetical protein n=1 Tax=Haloferula sp. TaxID=2497595 RepID=UPI003C73EA37